MTTDLPGIPAGLASLDLRAGSASIRVDGAAYPLDALYGAAYVFIDRCYVLLDRPEGHGEPDGGWRVTLAWKSGEPTAEQLRALAGEFANELLSCAWRSLIARENRTLIESVTAQALVGAMGPPSLDDLEKFDFSEATFEDPLGIAMSWEDKHKRKAQADDPSAVPPTHLDRTKP
jgi:His-Xaa-Ser system protein HxsD